MRNDAPPSDESPSVRYRRGMLRFGDIWTASPAMKLCLQTAQSVAALDMAVLILGETGTGKNLLAQAIHNASPRADGPFVEFNSASVPAMLADNELFGHEAGAFTGATSKHLGLFEQACGGTLFLDEIGNMAPEVQAKILSAVETRRIRRLGGQEPVECDVRLLCATNTNVESALASGSLRQDLYFRVARCVLRVPSLRERPEDIPFLVERFLALDNAHYNRAVERVSPACMARLLEHPWPGNVRELRAKVSFATALCEGPELLPQHVFPDPQPRASGEPAAEVDLSLAGAERRHIAKVLALAHGNITQAARLLGITRSTLREKIGKHSLQRPSD